LCFGARFCSFSAIRFLLYRKVFLENGVLGAYGTRRVGAGVKGESRRGEHLGVSLGRVLFPNAVHIETRVEVNPNAVNAAKHHTVPIYVFGPDEVELSGIEPLRLERHGHLVVDIKIHAASSGRHDG
jgi:hypothetical protein